jgi:hypothetical protein
MYIYLTKVLGGGVALPGAGTADPGLNDWLAPLCTEGPASQQHEYHNI